MSKKKNDVLFNLIKRLTKAEKRFFKVSTRSSNGSDKLFIQLFDALEKMEIYDEKMILKKVPELKRSQLSNMKAHLLKHVLKTVRHLHINQKLDIEIRDQQDNARVFYSKGMYVEALQVLEKAKRLALRHEMHTAYFNCVEFEKKIESQHITGSVKSKAEHLSKEVIEALKKVNANNQLSNLSLLLYGRYLSHGYVKEELAYLEVMSFFNQSLDGINYDSLDFYGKLYFYQSHVWYYIHVQDFSNYYKYALKWKTHYESHPTMILKESAMYLKGIHNFLNAIFMFSRGERFSEEYDSFLNFKLTHHKFLDQNCLQLVSNIELIHGVNKYIVEVNYDDGELFLNRLLTDEVKSEIQSWNLHRKFTIYYKIACVYFGAEKYNEALEYLNIINNKPYPDFRNDLQCFSRILSLLCHYELGNIELVSYQIKSVFRFLLKVEEMQKVQQEVFQFLKKLPRMTQSDLMPAFISLEAKLLKLRKVKFEKRAFLYLDITAWLRSKIERVPIQHVIRRSLKT